MGQVVRFPKLPVREYPNVKNDLLDTIKKKQMHNFAESVVREFATGILVDLESAGIDVHQKEFIRDYLYSMDVLRSGIYRSFGLTHYLQPFLDKNVRFNEEDSVLEINDALRLQNNDTTDVDDETEED
jgi:hypothetical protein